MKIAGLDVFRKLPRDLTRGTSHGGILTLLTFLTLSLLLFFETWSYFAGATSTHLILDNRNRDSTLTINLDISFPRIPCKYAKVTLWDYLGNSRLDLVEGVRKYELRGEGKLVSYEEFEHQADGKEVIEGLRGYKQEAGGKIKHHDDGGFIEVLGEDNFEKMIKRDEYAIVMFYVEWCIFCQRLIPQWELLSREIVESHLENIGVFAVNCEESVELCQRKFVTGYPTVRMYKGGNGFKKDYMGGRTADQIYTYLMDTIKDGHEKNEKRINTFGFDGCFFHLRLNVNRVPGKLEFSAASKEHSFNVMSTNASHFIHHFSFGEGMPISTLKKIPADIRANIAPLDNNEFTNHVRHMSHEHYIKVITTHYERSSMFGKQDIQGYQMAFSNHMYPSDPNVPETRFSFDLSPTAVVISQTGRRWYEFLTSLCGILGGTFTVFSLIDRGVDSMRNRIRRGDPRSPMGAKQM